MLRRRHASLAPVAALALAASLAAAPFAGAALASEGGGGTGGGPPKSAAGAFKEMAPGAANAAFDRAAIADLRHAGADLRAVRVRADGPVQPGHAAPTALRAPGATRLAAAAAWAERAETEMLNRASYDARGHLTRGQAINPNEAIADIADLRGDLAGHRLGQARADDRQAARELRMGIPRGA